MRAGRDADRAAASRARRAPGADRSRRETGIDAISVAGAGGAAPAEIVSAEAGAGQGDVAVAGRVVVAADDPGATFLSLAGSLSRRSAAGATRANTGADLAIAATPFAAPGTGGCRLSTGSSRPEGGERAAERSADQPPKPKAPGGDTGTHRECEPVEVPRLHDISPFADRREDGLGSPAGRDRPGYPNRLTWIWRPSRM
jgi:hypothetical protein